MIQELSPEYHVRPLRESDADGPYPGWFEDQEVTRFSSHGKFFRTREHFREYVRQTNGTDRIVWAICHTAAGHIGNVTLQEISGIDRTAEFAILIGNREHAGRGVGKLAGAAILDHGFNKLNLARIYCGTAATNAGMIALAYALGMKQEGVRRQQLFLAGERVDVVEFGILRDEFVRPR